MKNATPLLAVGTLALAFAAAPAASAEETECGTPATSAVYKTVTLPGKPAVYEQVKVVDVEAVPAVPAVTEEVKVIDVAYQPATPGSPAVEEVLEVSHMEQVLVTPAKDAVPEVLEESHMETIIVTPAVEGQHYSLKGSSKLGKDEVPPTPEEAPDLWQANAKDEPNGHYVSATDDDGTAYEDGESGLHFTSHGQYGEGNRDWFYFKAGTPAVTEEVKVIDVEYVPGSPAVPAVYKDVKVIDVEYVPGKDAVPATPEVLEVSHMETVVVTPEVPAVEEVFHYEDVLVSEAVPATKDKVLVSEATPAGDPCAIPTSARFGGPDSLAQTGSDTWIPVSLGAALLLAGGVLVAGSRRKVTA